MQLARFHFGLFNQSPLGQVRHTKSELQWPYSKTVLPSKRKDNATRQQENYPAGSKAKAKSPRKRRASHGSTLRAWCYNLAALLMRLLILPKRVVFIKKIRSFSIFQESRPNACEILMRRLAFLMRPSKRIKPRPLHLQTKRCYLWSCGGVTTPSNRPSP